MAKTCVNFTAAQVLAALRGEVVAVREAVKFPPRAHTPNTDWIASVNPDGKDGWVAWGPLPVTDEQSRAAYPNGGGFKCPYTIGNTLWVRETWYDYLIGGDEIGIIYKATHSKNLPQPKDDYGRWRSPAIMGRDYSRLSVTVQSVAVEQVDGGWEWVTEMVKAQP